MAAHTREFDASVATRWAGMPVWVWFGLADFTAVMAIPMAASLARQITENLMRNLCFWSLLAGITVLMVGSYGGYRGQAATMLRRHGWLAIRCFLAAVVAMLCLAVLLGHPHILARRWTFADLALTPGLIMAGRRVATVMSGPGCPRVNGPLVVCHGGVPDGLAGALREHQIGLPVSG
ncbi:MAG: hypothetical protein POH28_02670, partial [Acidocella sp.]|nr:hypothetical protein [Acidocella sp.]